MKTLFLNPNSSDEITATLRRHIARCGWPAERWDVAKVEGSPRIIGSATQNAEAEAALKPALPAASAGFDRVVMMSSVDTGYEIARRRFGDAAFGFTRSVLAQQRRLGRQLQVVTFDKDMTPLYEAAFAATGNGAVVAGWTVIDLKPVAVAMDAARALEELRAICRRLSPTSPNAIFVVGAVGLELVMQLRRDSVEGLVDPVADLLAWLDKP